MKYTEYQHQTPHLQLLTLIARSATPPATPLTWGARTVGDKIKTKRSRTEIPERRDKRTCDLTQYSEYLEPFPDLDPTATDDIVKVHRGTANINDCKNWYVGA